MTQAQNRGTKIAAAGAAALAAAAATAYYFAFNKNAKKHRQTVKGWAHKAKTEVIKELKNLKTITRPAYEKAVSEIVKKYGEYEEAAPTEILKLQKELKTYWSKIAKDLKTATSNKKPATKKLQKQQRKNNLGGKD